jgi:endoglucanase
VRLNEVNWYGADDTNYVVTGLQYNPVPNIPRLIKQQGYNAVLSPWSNQLYETNPVVSSTVLTANPGLQGLTALQIIYAWGTEGVMVIIDNHESTAGICCGSDVNQLWYNTAYLESSWLSDWRCGSQPLCEASQRAVLQLLSSGPQEAWPPSYQDGRRRCQYRCRNG